MWKSKISFVGMLWLLGCFDSGEISGFLSLGSAWHWNSFLSVCTCKFCHVQSWVRICAYLQLFHCHFLPCGTLTVGVSIAAFFMLCSVHYFSKRPQTRILSRRKSDHKKALQWYMDHWSDEEESSYLCTISFHLAAFLLWAWTLACVKYVVGMWLCVKNYKTCHCGCLQMLTAQCLWNCPTSGFGTSLMSSSIRYSHFWIITKAILFITYLAFTTCSW